MYFYEILHSCHEEALTEAFLKLCTGSPDLQQTKKIFQEFLKNIKAISPERSDEWTIFMTPEQIVYAGNLHDSERYGLEITPWKEVLGWKTDAEAFTFFSKEEFTAAVLWEITFFGFDEETIQEHVRSWKEIE
ncbi:MAG: hypothetical protein IKI37_02700 [Oscillospiraceae bacterium]|nr:hypothetical protein [Oscillospiraceae bacterium]MBR7084074.1 hypothetical protein [Oscillospiraceae bacterium]